MIKGEPIITQLVDGAQYIFFLCSCFMLSAKYFLLVPCFFVSSRSRFKSCRFFPSSFFSSDFHHCFIYSLSFYCDHVTHTSHHA